MLCFFFFKQKTAYEMRISDWSSDVCSSDLLRSANSFSAPLRAANANANLSFPLYQGGRVKNSIRAADARVESGRANLRFTEADVFTAIVSVYMDVMRDRSEEHTSELQSLMRISYAVFCLKKKKKIKQHKTKPDDHNR